MNKRELIQTITDRLNETGVKKDVKCPDEVQLFDCYGNSVATIPIDSVSYVCLDNHDVEAVLNLSLEIIAEQISEGNKVSIHGYFKIYPDMRPQRSVIAPDTKEPISIGAHHVVKIKPGNILKQAALELDDIDFAEYYPQLLAKLSGGDIDD